MSTVKLMVSLLLTVGGLAGITQAQAQDYPSRPIRLIICWGPGSSTDITGRIVIQKVSENMGQSIVVENRPGAEGMIAAEAGALATPDGYTILLGSNSTHGSHPVFRKTRYDAVKDFEPVAKMSTVFYVLVSSTGLKVNSVKDLVDLAKSNPGKRTLANTGGIAYLTGELFKHTVGIDMLAVPYRLAATAFADLQAGSVDVMFQSLPSAGPLIRAGRLKTIAMTAAQRSRQIPDVPTVAESGYPGFESVAWLGFFVPARTPKAIVKRLNQEIQRSLDDPETRKRLLANGTSESEIGGGSSEQLRQTMLAEISKWPRLSQVARIQIE